MNTNTPDPRPPSLIDIEVLDLGPLYEQAVEHYLSLEPGRLKWSPEKRARLRIRTECRWGRVQFHEQDVYMVNECGQGPTEALSEQVKAHVALYAELLPAEGDAGLFESLPFCRVEIDREAAVSFRSLGIVALEDFIRSKLPEMEAAYDAWLGLLQKSRDKCRTVRSRKKVPVGASA